MKTNQADTSAAVAAVTHTPGPWLVGRQLSNTGAVPVRWNGENLAWVCGVDSANQFTPQQAMANAVLVAHAPELLACLRTLRNAAMDTPALDGSDEWTELITMADRLMARAEGRQ